MNIIRKRKIRIKWKNIFIISFIIFILIFSINKIAKITTSPKTKENKNIQKENQKLSKLNYINEKIDYFNPKYIDRYIKYKEENKSLSDEQIIKNVNMNLDKIKYEYIKKAKYLNTNKILVNKYYYLEKNYIPNNLEEISNRYALNGMKLVKEAKEAFEKLSQDASNSNLKIIAMSTYRSYDYQIKIFNQYIKIDGEEKVETYSGKPGYSEHQTGLAVDVYNGKDNYTNFEETEEFKWMMEHAHEYGYILRFPKGKEEETGYIYEAWHYRYVGIDIANYIKKHNISYEEYYATKIKDW